MNQPIHAITYCRRRELDGQHAFYLAPAIKNKKSIAPRNYFLQEMSYPSSFLKHPFLPATEKPRFFNSRRKPFLLPQQKTHGFAKKICSRNRKTMVFELSSVARLTPEGPGGEPPVYELGKAMDWGPDTLFPQRSRNSPATQLGGGAPMAPHGAIFHETFSAIEWHMAAIH